MLRIISVEQDGSDGVLVHFSDGSVAGYVVEELLELRPARERASETGPLKQNTALVREM